MRYLQFSWLLAVSVMLFSVLYVAYGQCNNDQRNILLQLKQNVTFFKTVNSTGTSKVSKLDSWNLSSDCCSSWDGVSCNGAGHVIGLDLSEELITGGFNDSSRLFDLVYLESLNLSHLRLNKTTIPSSFERLANLSSLNLSDSGFTGQIPQEIVRLKKLVSLDISTLFPGKIPLSLRNPDLGELVRDLSQLKELHLDGVNISASGNEWCQALSSALPKLQILRLSNCHLSYPFHSSFSKLISLVDIRLDLNDISAVVPEYFANFTNLSSLHLSYCNLTGSFPENIFKLPRLQMLDVSFNPSLRGILPEFPQNSSLQNLLLSYTNFTGKLPDSFGTLTHLSKLELASCSFSGPLPPSMENLTQLNFIDLSHNKFTGLIPSLRLSKNLIELNLAWNRLSGPLPPFGWEDIVKLEYLYLGNNLLDGSIPSALFTMPSLRLLDLSSNKFSGQPSVSTNNSSSALSNLDLSNNKLEGPIPLSIFNLESLIIFKLSYNKFNGTLWLDKFEKLRNLRSLDLAGNNLSIVTGNVNSSLFPQVGTLKLGSCNLKVFPNFLRNQSTMSILDLSDNQIEERIPSWIWKIGKGTLLNLNLSRNSLRNPEQPFPSGSFELLAFLDLHSNLLQGEIPILPAFATYLDYSMNNFSSPIQANISSYLHFTLFFSLASNRFSGKIPESLCEATYLQVLDLSKNNFSGFIPQCLGHASSLRVLNLRDNHFDGSMPENFREDCNLRTLDLNGNKLTGEVAKYLSNCTMLEVLDLGNNQINGRFPYWLGDLLYLRVLVLRSNKLQGVFGNPIANKSFEMLQIIDISSNSFSGVLHSDCFLSWKEMMITEEESESKYKHDILRFGVLQLSNLYYQDSITVTSKGLEMDLVKILTVFTSIDFSNNMFEGEIPHVIGQLSSLYVLNFSHNGLNGTIPASMGNLSQLESLDLSQNMFSGEIPTQLADLNFLSVLNLSYNQLEGRIPTGEQLQTFADTSYQGNTGLCGVPLSKTCTNNSKVIPTPKFRASEEDNKFNWEFIMLGLGFGAGMGFVLGLLLFYKRRRKWFEEKTDILALMIVSKLARFLCIFCRIRKVDTDEDMTEEQSEITADYHNEEEDEQYQKSRKFCVFCTKLDKTKRMTVHNTDCSCHVSPPFSFSI